MALYSFHRRSVFACALAWMSIIACWISSAQAFILSDLDFEPWLATASGSRSGNGRPVTLTWSIVADGTSTPDLEGAKVGSNLISFLDSTFGGNPIGSNPNNLTARPWFDLLQSTFARWESLGGINYVYEPNDSGTTLGSAAGLLGVRGDIRIAGRNIDGVSNTLAFNFLPDNGDMVLDTSESSFFGEASNNSNFRAFRNTVAHELGHGLAMEHVVSGTDNLLLEPSISVNFDGPQLDEVRAVHYYYGDINEKSHNGLGNDIATRATNLGVLALGSSKSVGVDADVATQFISSTATDFVSISNLNDTDYYSFSILESGLLDAVLTPRGGTFSQSGQGGFPTSFDANARSDLALTIFDTDGTSVLSTVNNGGLGASDTLDDLNLLAAGQYFARVTGAADTIQLYQLDLSLHSQTFLEADFNEDSAVDATDLAILKAALGTNNFGDTDDDGDTDGADFLVWQQQFNQQFNQQVVAIASTASVPEPSTACLLAIGVITLIGRYFRGEARLK